MLPWSSVERRWRDALLAAMIPAPPGGELPALGDLDLGDFWDRVAATAPPMLRLGVRTAVWVITWSPLWVLRRPRLFPALDPDDRDRVLVRLATSRLFLVRQLVDVLKLMACFAYFRDPAARAALGER